MDEPKLESETQRFAVSQIFFDQDCEEIFCEETLEKDTLQEDGDNEELLVEVPQPGDSVKTRRLRIREPTTRTLLTKDPKTTTKQNKKKLKKKFVPFREVPKARTVEKPKKDNEQPVQKYWSVLNRGPQGLPGVSAVSFSTVTELEKLKRANQKLEVEKRSLLELVSSFMTESAIIQQSLHKWSTSFKQCFEKIPEKGESPKDAPKDLGKSQTNAVNSTSSPTDSAQPQPKIRKLNIEKTKPPGISTHSFKVKCPPTPVQLKSSPASRLVINAPKQAAFKGPVPIPRIIASNPQTIVQVQEKFKNSLHRQLDKFKKQCKVRLASSVVKKTSDKVNNQPASSTNSVPRDDSCPSSQKPTAPHEPTVQTPFVPCYPISKLSDLQAYEKILWNDLWTSKQEPDKIVQMCLNVEVADSKEENMLNMVKIIIAPKLFEHLLNPKKKSIRQSVFPGFFYLLSKVWRKLLPTFGITFSDKNPFLKTLGHTLMKSINSERKPEPESKLQPKPQQVIECSDEEPSNEIYFELPNDMLEDESACAAVYDDPFTQEDYEMVEDDGGTFYITMEDENPTSDQINVDD